MQGIDDPNNSTITSKRMNQRDMRKKKNMIPSRSDSKATNYTEILNSPSDGQKNIVNIWIRSWQLIFHKQLRGKSESVRDMKTSMSLAAMVKDRCLDHSRKGQITRTTVNKVLVWPRQAENPNPYIPKHLRFRQRPVEGRERLEPAMETSVMDKLVPSLLLPLQLGGRHKNGKNGKNNYFCKDTLFWME